LAPIGSATGASSVSTLTAFFYVDFFIVISGSVSSASILWRVFFFKPWSDLAADSAASLAASMLFLAFSTVSEASVVSIDFSGATSSSDFLVLVSSEASSGLSALGATSSSSSPLAAF
jgi:hypothetical protein